MSEQSEIEWVTCKKCRGFGIFWALEGVADIVACDECGENYHIGRTGQVLKSKEVNLEPL